MLLEEQGLGKPLQNPSEPPEPMGRFTPGLLFEEKNLKAESPSWSLWPPVVWLLEGKSGDLPRDVEDWDKVWQSLCRSRQSSIGDEDPWSQMPCLRTEAGQE